MHADWPGVLDEARTRQRSRENLTETKKGSKEALPTSAPAHVDGGWEYWTKFEPPRLLWRDFVSVSSSRS
jgi:hypothetical protein